MIRLVRLKRQGVRRRGDLAATRRRYTFEAISLESARALVVHALDKHTHGRISGIDFGIGARLSEV